MVVLCKMSKGTKNPVRQWEITFPQVGDATTRETFHESFPPSEYSICCCEKHADGGLHLHLGIVFKKGISKANLLDWIVCKFPGDYKRIHLSGIRAMSKWQDYCKKEDPEVFERGSLQQRGKKRSPWADEDMERMLKEALEASGREGEDGWRYLVSQENETRLSGIRDLEEEQCWLKENGYLP